MKLEYIVFVNSLDKFDIEHCRNKVKVTVGLQKFPHLPQYKLSGPKLNFGTSKEVHVKHLSSSDTNIQSLRISSWLNDFMNSYRALKVDSLNSISQLWIMLGS